MPTTNQQRFALTPDRSKNHINALTARKESLVEPTRRTSGDVSDLEHVGAIALRVLLDVCQKAENREARRFTK